MAIKPAIEEVGLTAWRGDEVKLGTNIIIRDVTRSIYDANIVIADISGRNPNVMYELGLAHAAKKNVIMLIQHEEEVPFDVRHVRFLKYDPLELTELKNALINRIKNTLLMKESERPDLFPELKLMNKSERDELDYLRLKTTKLDITVYPPTADIFFNNKFVGNNKAHISVNIQAPYNTISCSCPDFYEIYIDINDEHLKAGSIDIKLDPKVDENISKRVSQWLRYRRKDPNNPVLMRAIASYLVGIQEYEEALTEAKELLEAAPDWYMAHNLVGYILCKMGRYDDMDKYFKKVVLLKPDHYIGYFNLACAAALRRNFKECLRYAKEITDDENRLESYIYRPSDLFVTDSDFDAIKSDETYSKEFEKIIIKIERFRKKFFTEANQTRSIT